MGKLPSLKESSVLQRGHRAGGNFPRNTEHFGHISLTITNFFSIIFNVRPHNFHD